MAVRTMADGNIGVYLLTTKPAASIPTATELNAGIDASCEVAKSGTHLRPTGSATVSDAPMCESGNSTDFGAANFEGQIAPFAYFDPATGKYSATDSKALEALDTKGTTIWVYFVEGVKPREGGKPEGGERVYGGQWTTDTPQPGPVTGEYLKRIVPLGYSGGWVDAIIPTV